MKNLFIVICLALCSQTGYSIYSRIKMVKTLPKFKEICMIIEKTDTGVRYIPIACYRYPAKCELMLFTIICKITHDLPKPKKD